MKILFYFKQDPLSKWTMTKAPKYWSNYIQGHQSRKGLGFSESEQAGEN